MYSIYWSHAAMRGHTVMYSIYPVTCISCILSTRHIHSMYSIYWSRAQCEVYWPICVADIFANGIAITLSSVSLELIAWNQRAWISLSLCVFSCITLLHLRTQIRCVDSAIRICRRREAPQLPPCLGVWFPLWVCS